MPRAAEPVRGRREPTPDRIRWTRGQCEAKRDAGFLTGRCELVDGEIISKMGDNPPHSTAAGLLQDWLTEVFGSSCVRVQDTVDVGDADPEHNQPHPDVVVTRLPRKAYASRHPGPEDSLLLAEAADTSVNFDRTTKAALYALAGVQEYWLLDIRGRRLFVHRTPGPGGYRDVAVYGADETLATLARPG